MSLSNKYKSVERSFLSLLSKSGMSLWRNINRFISFIKNAAKSRFTVMLIPHSEKKVINFKISALMLSFLAFLAVTVIASFVISGILFTAKSNDSKSNKMQLATIEQHNKNYQQAIENFNKPYREFESSLNVLLKNHLSTNNLQQSGRSGDYADIEIFDETENGGTPLKSILENATKDLEVYTQALIERAQQESKIDELLKHIPVKWPVGRNEGRITAFFGPAPHPILRTWYLHTGVDIASMRGTPIVAAADGKVIEMQYNRDYGNYIIIRHEYGFYSKYAHLDGFYVKEGDLVTQGQHIAPLGNTGLSTGPHLHFEIRINSQVIDPYKYIKLLRR